MSLVLHYYIIRTTNLYKGIHIKNLTQIDFFERRCMLKVFHFKPLVISNNTPFLIAIITPYVFARWRKKNKPNI